VVDRFPIEAPEPMSADVVWLYEPPLDAGLHPPMTYRPSELLGVIDDVLTEAGIDDVVVTGTIQGLRRRARWWGFDLVEMAPKGESAAATLRTRRNGVGRHRDGRQRHHPLPRAGVDRHRPRHQPHRGRPGRQPLLRHPLGGRLGPDRHRRQRHSPPPRRCGGDGTRDRAGPRGHSDRTAWLTVAVVLSVLIAVLVAGLGR
jgi:hypothetical protein